MLGESIRTAFATVGDAIKDPKVQKEARQAAASFFDALGTTFSELGDDISRRRQRGETPAIRPRTRPIDRTPPNTRSDHVRQRATVPGARSALP